MSNLVFVAINTAAVRAVFALGAVGIALVAEEQGWGLLNIVALPGWLRIGLAVLALDLAIYLQHVMFHAVPVFWRFHRVHHADLDFDVTTGVRFHTIEILLSMDIKVAAIVSLGAPAIAVLIFEVLLSATSLFNHSNAQMPLWVDRLLRLLVVATCGVGNDQKHEANCDSLPPLDRRGIADSGTICQTMVCYRASKKRYEQQRYRTCLI